MKNLLSILLIAAMLSATTNSLVSQIISGTIDDSLARPVERVKLFSNEEFFSKSDYIMEVKPASIGATVYDIGGNYNPDEFYTSSFMIITHVYKNDVTMPVFPGDTVNFIHKGGGLLRVSKDDPSDSEFIMYPSPTDYAGGKEEPAMSTDGCPTIYFIKKSDLPEHPDISKRNTYPKLSMLQDLKRATIKIPGNSAQGLNDLYFESRHELYKYMAQFEGVNVPPSEPGKKGRDLSNFPEHLKERYAKEQAKDPPHSSNSANHAQSQSLIDRFNTLRAKNNLESIKQDTVLDNISKILLTNKTYKNSAGVYNEDSVRLLLYNSGIIDYRYEIREVLDKDTATVFKIFLLSDKSNYLRVGYYHNGNRHLLFKTKSYLKFDHGTAKNWCDPIKIPVGVPVDSTNTTAKCYVDSIVNYLKILISDQYYYQFHEKIPLSREKGKNIQKKEVQMTSGISQYGEYDFTTIALGPEAYMFVVILNKKNERVAVIK